MATVPYRYLEDLTGTSPNNKVVNDDYDLSVNAVRAVAVRYGPFFAESIKVVDLVTNIPLVKDKDYSLVGLLPDLTARTGKGIYDSLLIVKKDMGNRVRLDYQTVGGPYLNQAQTIADLAEAAGNDNRPVDWITGVLNKPLEYNPSIHSHWLNDVVGWGPIVAGLDRIATAITIGQAPVFNFLLSKLDVRRATIEEVMDGESDNKFITPEALRLAMTSMNFNAMYLVPYINEMRYGQDYEFKLGTNLPDAFDDMYWKIEHENTDPSDFAESQGHFKMVLGQGNFFVRPAASKVITEDKFFRVAIMRDTPEGRTMVKSLRIKIPANWQDSEAGINTARMNSLYSSCCLFDVQNRDPIGMFFSEKNG